MSKLCLQVNCAVGVAWLHPCVQLFLSLVTCFKSLYLSQVWLLTVLFAVVVAEYWQTCDKVEQMQRQIQDINVRTPYDSTMSMSHALIRRELLRKQTQTLTSIIASATADVRYSTKDIRRVSVLDVPTLKEKLSAVKKHAKEMDLAVQKCNWEIDIP